MLKIIRPKETSQRKYEQYKIETSRHFRKKRGNIFQTKSRSLQRTVKTITLETCIEE
jgi:hypothetical protein